MTREQTMNRRKRVTWLITLLCWLSLSFSGAWAAATQRRVQFHIPPQLLASALIQFSDQANVQVVSEAVDVSHVYSHGVSGSMNIENGLTRLLSDTGFSFVPVDGRTFAIRHGSVDAAAAAGTESDPPQQLARRDDPPAGQQDAVQQNQSAQQEALKQKNREKIQALSPIVITGTRIDRPGYDTLESISVTTSKQIEDRGYTNVLQALQATPGFGAPGSSPLSSQQSRFSIGQSFANYFGLGSQRTLTLVDGQRFVSSNSLAAGNASPGSQVDLNLIPVGLIDHIETVAIGGAPVYGADAIAGTVNIILKDHYQGMQATAQYGVSDRGDARNRLYSVLMGGNFDEDRGNAVISVTHSEQDPLIFSDRYGLIEPLANPADTGPNDGIPASIFNPDTHLDFFTEGGLPYDGSILDIPGLHYPGLYPNGNYIFNSSGQPLRFDSNGQLVPMDFGKITSAANLGGGASVPLYSQGGDGVDAARHFGLLAGTKRTMFNGIAHYDLTSNVRASVNTMYAHTTAVLPSDLTSIIAPNLLNSPSLNFSVDNPFLSDQARGIIQANGLTSFNLARNMNDIVDRTPATMDVDLYRVVAGLNGTFSAFGNTWSWNASYNYGRSRSTSRDTYINPDRLLLAADAVRDASGNIVCASGGDCVPIDLFGENAFSTAAANYVTDHGTAISTNTEKDFVTDLSGPLPLNIAGADPVRFNLGYERRSEDAKFEPDLVFMTGDQLDGVPGATPISGGFTTNEIYGEAFVPVISNDENVSWLKSMNFDLAARNVDNSINGSALTWSAGGRIAPRFSGWADGLLFRGVYTRSIRAPAITELFLPASGVLGAIVDPCDAGQVTLGPDPAVRQANCAAALAAVGAPAPGNFNSTTRTISVAGISSGNANLKNEAARSWSVGMVYQPVEHPQFRFSADWSHIALKNGIELLGINDILAACYDSTSYPNSACSEFTRLTAAQATSPRTTGDIAAGYHEGYVNTASIDFSGLILAGQYDAALSDIFHGLHDAGDIDVKATLFHRIHFGVADIAGQAPVEEAGTTGAPKYRAALDLGYNWHDFDTEWNVLWTDSVVIDNTATIENYPEYRIPSYTLVNATFGYQLTDQLHLQFVVNNVFNKSLPLVALEQRAFSVYDPIGRAYMLRLTATLP